MSTTDEQVQVQLQFSLELTTDPLGATLDVAVPEAPTDEARQALLDSIERTLVGAQGNLVFQAVQEAHDQLEAYGSSNDYHTDSIVDSFAGVDADRDQTSIHAEWSWEHEGAMFFEFGTSDHPVTPDGDVLVFPFDPEEYPYLEEMFPDGVAFLPKTNVSGLPEARWVRDSLNWLRREVGQA